MYRTLQLRLLGAQQHAREDSRAARSTEHDFFGYQSGLPWIAVDTMIIGPIKWMICMREGSRF